jgi:hypothetical protein
MAKGQHGNVVLLAEELRSGGNFAGGLAADGPRAFEAEKFAGRGSGFDDAVPKKRSELNPEFASSGIGRDAEPQSRSEVELFI